MAGTQRGGSDRGLAMSSASEAVTRRGQRPGQVSPGEVPHGQWPAPCIYGLPTSLPSPGGVSPGLLQPFLRLSPPALSRGPHQPPDGASAQWGSCERRGRAWWRQKSARAAKMVVSGLKKGPAGGGGHRARHEVAALSVVSLGCCSASRQALPLVFYL